MNLRDLVSRFPGKCPLFLCILRKGAEPVFIEAHEKYGVDPSLELEEAVNELLGEEGYHVSVVQALPERERRRWEKRTEPVVA